MPEQWQQFGEVLVALDAVGYKGVKSLGGECFYRAKNYQQAVNSWEVDNVAKKPEYHRAKAKMVGMPDGLEYLVEAGDYDGIIGEWVGAGKPRDRRWLHYVAVALETKRYYQQAFVIYVWLDELVKVKECFELARQSTASIKLITVLFQYFFRKKYWSEGMDAIEKYLIPYIGTDPKKSAVKFEVVYEIACSELRSQQIRKDQQKRVEKFIKEYILSTSEWTQYLLMQQVGIALEKLGVLIGTLSFYEQFFDNYELEIRQFARERWIATKQKHEDYAKNQGKFDKAVKAKSELLKQSNSWSISPESVSLVPPAAPKERPRPKIHKSAAQSATQLKLKTIKQPVIQGLPSDSIIEQLEDGVIGFGVRHLRIKVMSSSKQVLIADSLNNREVRVDWAQCQVNIGEATIEVSGGNQLSFAIFASGYSGVLICDRKQSRLELEVQGCVSKISIDL
ncbi:MAG TPA: hypothetical protein DEG47_32945 [Cyanobacteria bacterium UBA11148]|nr:hypothetical protein [Cyanobacteria bacterium UBA11148]